MSEPIDLEAIERAARGAKDADDSPWVVKTNDARIAKYIRTMDPDVSLAIIAAVRERDAEIKRLRDLLEVREDGERSVRRLS